MSQRPTHTPRADDPAAPWKTPELEGVDELSARAFRAFLFTGRQHFKTMMAAVAGSRAHPGQAMCLRLLGSNDGASQRDVARLLHVAPPTVSKMLRGMEKAGLVERRADEADQRLTRVYLTAAGRERSREIGAAVSGLVNATFATLSERERRELARLLEKLGARLSEVGAERASGGLAASGGHAASGGPAASGGEPGR